jgi:uncharacterized protein (TIGR03083 family)
MTPAPLTVEEHLTGLEVAAGRLAGWAEAAGPDAEVPTCPGWRVRDLLAHQGMVHRWATAVVRGVDQAAVDADGLVAEGLRAEDPVAWLRDGAHDLLTALRDAPEDLEVFTFLKEAPPARVFWARRQHHETTVHALDALSALEARFPTPADAWFGDAAALDGIDELLVGFWQRRTKGPRAPEDGAYSALVSAGSGEHWCLDVTAESTRTRRLDTSEPGAGGDVRVLSGSPVDLYLALWNRGGDVEDPTGLVELWRDGGSIRW